MAPADPDVPVEIRTQASAVSGANRTYARDIRLGRGEQCEVQVETGVVSRVHAKIVFENGRWWVVDADSTNGTYLDGEPVDRAPLPPDAEVQLGTDGPTFQLSRPDADGQGDTAGATTQAERAPSEETRRTERPSSESDRPPTPETGSDVERPSGSVTQYVRHYFEGPDQSAGEHTRKVRRAYRRVQRKERRSYLWAVAGALVLSLLLGGYAVWQHQRNEQNRERAREVFTAMKEQEVAIANLKRRIEESNDDTLRAQLASIEEAQRKQGKRYNGFVRELGFRRKLAPRERVIYRTARIFGESEFGIPAGFVRKVKETIETYWQREGRSRLVDAVRRAEEKEYTGFIVNTMREHALPPEFFYLALQESDLKVNRVGPPTRHGIAKGMWQFIPSTAREYGLRVGPRRGEPRVDRQDERHDFKKSTRAAARYLRDIYSTEAQASGLLVIASYHWGEHRVTDKLEHLPKGIPEQALEGIPQNPEKRNYWRFLKEYSDRMPEETRDYVLKVFSAAVIGRNPELFGFEFQNPLREHMDVAAPRAADASTGGRKARGGDTRRHGNQCLSCGAELEALSAENQQTVLFGAPRQAPCRRPVGRANERGEYDNGTALVVHRNR